MIRAQYGSSSIQFITTEDWQQCRSWAAHIEGAIALLQLRGRQQFSNERGSQLFAVLRAQVVGPANSSISYRDPGECNSCLFL